MIMDVFICHLKSNDFITVSMAQSISSMYICVVQNCDVGQVSAQTLQKNYHWGYMCHLQSLRNNRLAMEEWNKNIRAGRSYETEQRPRGFPHRLAP